MMHYLDHAATSPLIPEALEAWTRAQRDLAKFPGNPSALHAGGRRARRMLEDARARVGHALGADPHEVVFTSGATESDVLAVSGTARGMRSAHPERDLVVLSGIEHDAVAKQADSLAREGFLVHVLDVDGDGVSVVDHRWCEDHRARIAVASMSLVSSEIGTIQPVTELVCTTAASHAGGYVHTDAAQAIPIIDTRFDALDVDLMTVGGHKIGAPVGTGALVIRRGIPFHSDRPGGGHERGIRSGTPDVAGACAFAAALDATVARRHTWQYRAQELRDHLIRGLPDEVVPSVRLDAAVPSIIHLSIPTARPEAVLMHMDMAGVMVSAGSACHAGVTRPSDIVMRMGRTEEQALGVLRISLGWETTTDDIDAFLAALPRALDSARCLDTITHVQGRAMPHQTPGSP
ncbi:cysteine desulfurase family protein [Schaalia sp. ZJ1691]|uniref:cysteine desulfurase family protein n=1 Tax=Schaalia sp. ZJ1691 TaxID=2709404 RepID=UPI0013EA8213|nr:cysteine desulfurase family protein [Schaalia sp. ZJ1691]